MLFETSLTPLPMFGLRRDMNRLLDDVITHLPTTEGNRRYQDHGELR
jgi:hypothetical protein